LDVRTVRKSFKVPKSSGVIGNTFTAKKMNLLLVMSVENNLGARTSSLAEAVSTPGRNPIVAASAI